MEPLSDSIKLPGVSNVARSYSSFFVDIWGVLLVNNELVCSAVETLGYLKSLGKQVVLVSNTSRRIDNLQSMLNQYGLPQELYSSICTAGQSAYNTIIQGRLKAISGESNWFEVGFQPGGSWTRFLRGNLVDDITLADAIIGFGFFENDRVKEEAADDLKYAAKKGIPFIVTNLDHQIAYSDIFYDGVATLKTQFDGLGGRSFAFGKPNPEIFFDASKQLQQRNSINKTLMIGDTYETDILGGQNFGIDTLFVNASAGKILKSAKLPCKSYFMNALVV